MDKITIKNISTATVNVVSDRFRRELVPGREVPISKAIYDDLMFDPGFNNLLTGHYLVVKGFKDEDSVIQQDEEIYDTTMIANFFDKKDYTGFARFLPKATMAEKDTVVQFAVEKGITDNGFTALIKKYCNVDVVSAINQKHQAEEK